MKLITFQDRRVLRTLNSKGVYRCRFKSDWSKRYKYAYKFLKDSMDMHSYEFGPIFTWYNIDGRIPLVIDLDTLRRAYEMVPYDNMIIIELDVPDSIGLKSDFYNFVDLIYFSTEGRSLKNFNLKSITEIKDETKREIQVTLPCIKKQWITAIYDYEIGEVEKIVDQSIFNRRYMREHGIVLPDTTIIRTITKFEKR